MASLSAHLSERAGERKSQRVLLSVPVVVSGEGPDSERLSEETHTLVLKAQGGLILLSLRVTVGQVLTIKNSRTEEELSCQVVHLSPGQSGKTAVAFKFMQPAPGFWRIAFPPANWTPRSLEARGHTKRSPAQ